MREVFMYALDWEVMEGTGANRIPTTRYMQFIMHEADPRLALPLIMSEVEAKWGKVETVKQFSGPRPHYFLIGRQS